MVCAHPFFLSFFFYTMSRLDYGDLIMWQASSAGTRYHHHDLSLPLSLCSASLVLRRSDGDGCAVSCLSFSSMAIFLCLSLDALALSLFTRSDKAFMLVLIWCNLLWYTGTLAIFTHGKRKRIKQWLVMNASAIKSKLMHCPCFGVPR